MNSLIALLTCFPINHEHVRRNEISRDTIKKKVNRNEGEEIEQSKVNKTIRPETIYRIKSTSSLLQHGSG